MTVDRKKYRPIKLSNGSVVCRILPELGGALLSLEIGGVPVLRSSPDEPRDILQTASFPLVPFNNRIADGRFDFGGQQITLPADPAAPPDAHHGHGWRRTWQVVSNGNDYAELAFVHESGAWPWRYRAVQRVQLLGDGLELVLTVANLSDRSMPCGFGFHPYFAMSRDSYLAVHAPSRLCPDKRGIPAVESAGLIGKHQLADLQISDDLLLDDTGQVRVGTNDWELTLTAIEAVGWQFYLPADRAYFCLEPVSHRPDSFNLPEPIETIEPGSFRDWHFTVRRTR